MMGRGQFERQLALHCAPTLAGLKAGSMVAFPLQDVEELMKLIQEYQQCLQCKGIRLRILSEQRRHILLLIYRPSILHRVLQRELAQKILHSCGYHADAGLEELLDCLCSRCVAPGDFPHEIGLFLGYPPQDVDGFIRFKGQKFVCSGYWKVYNNEKAVRRLFACYQDCIQRICSRLEKGESLEAMILQAG